MEEEKVIQVSVQLPAQALQGFTDMVRQLRQLAAELRGGPRAGAEAMENAAFDEERFLTMQEAPAAKSVRTEAGPGAKGPASAARQVRDQVPDPDTAGKEIPSAGEEGDRDGRREEARMRRAGPTAGRTRGTSPPSGPGRTPRWRTRPGRREIRRAPSRRPRPYGPGRRSVRRTRPPRPPGRPPVRRSHRGPASRWQQDRRPLRAGGAA